MDARAPAVGRDASVGPSSDLVVRGTRLNPVRLFPSLLLCAAMAWFAHRGQIGGTIVIIVLGFAALDLYRGVLLWMRPARIELKQGRFVVCVDGSESRCPAADVANVVVLAKHLFVVFHDLARLQPERLRPALADRFAKQGFHVGGAAGQFTLAQVNQFRSAMGWAPQPADESGDRIDQFRSLLRRLTPHVVVTPTLIALCVGVFVAMVASGVGILNPTRDDLIAWGANYSPKTLDGQWWRLVTSMFIHVGLLHLFFNMWVLWDIGRLVERFVGNVGFALAYFVSGIAGSLASAWWSLQVQIPSAGASGAVFGVLGVLLALVVRGRRSIPAEVYQALRGSVIAFLAFNLLFGLSIQGIDMAAHLGGLGAGFLVGIILVLPLSEEAGTSRIRRNLLAAAVGIAGLAAAIHAMPEPPGDFPEALNRFAEVEKQVLAAYKTAADKWQARQLSDEQFADVVVRDVLPPWRDARDRLAAIRKPPSRDVLLLGRLLTYAQLRQEAWELWARGIRTKDPSKIEEAGRKTRDADAAVKQINAAASDGNPQEE